MGKISTKFLEYFNQLFIPKNEVIFRDFKEIYIL